VGTGKALALIEVRSIARGIRAADAGLKAARVRLLVARPVCPGKFLIMIGGQVGDVRAGLEAAIDRAEPHYIDHFFLANAHPSLLPAFTATTAIPVRRALGIVETDSAASCVIAADQAAKSADVTVVQVRLAYGLGGRAVAYVTGSVGAVNMAVEAARRTVAETGFLRRAAVIPAPDRVVWERVV